MVFININGNIQSLKDSILKEIEALYDIETDKSEFLPRELAFKLAQLTWKINREIAVYISRKGSILDISLGDSSTVSLPQFEGRKDESRLSGVRCIHTHPNGDGRLSSVDINSLIKLRLDSMVAIGVEEGAITEIYAGIPCKHGDAAFNHAQVYGPYDVEGNQLDFLFEVIAENDRSSENTLYVNEAGEERAILVGLEVSPGKLVNGKSEGERLLEELEELADTAGATVVYKVLQKRPVKDSAYFIGRGKAEEISLIRQALNANLIIFDDELSGAQVRNIEGLAGTKVIDRTTLILDIFAQRARSREGKLQVELAQLKYRLPRLIGLGSQLSRLGGGIGTRGPGEKKLEVDRRHIRRRIGALEEELDGIRKRRGLIREGRRNNEIPTAALVGYTNAGKSTLMNRLCKAEVFAEDKLFATLDPTARKLELPDGRNIMLIDTVGFIRKLPHDLVDAFKSTLEEAVFADILIHVADVSSEEAETQIQVVNDILTGLGVSDKPSLMVLNKADQADEDFRIPLAVAGEDVVEVSALTGQGIQELTQYLAGMLPSGEEEVVVTVPYSEGWVVPYMYDNGKVIHSEYTEAGTVIKAVMERTKIERIRNFTVSNDSHNKQDIN